MVKESATSVFLCASVVNHFSGKTNHRDMLTLLILPTLYGWFEKERAFMNDAPDDVR
jgi:hypothetical protein